MRDPDVARFFVLAVFVACAPASVGDDGGATLDAGSADVRPIEDAGGADVQSHDGAIADAQSADAGAIAPGFGDIAGPCQQLDDELTSPLPFYFDNHIDFGHDPYDDADEAALTSGGRQIIADGNAGGSSLLSEVFAFEVLARCESAALLKTENEVIYDDPQSKLTDLLVDIDGSRVGVSVTRAVAFPFTDPYSVAQAETLLTGKLEDILISSANVAEVDRWQKQILFVVAYASEHATALRTAYQGLPAETKADTILYVTVSDGEDAFLY